MTIFPDFLTAVYDQSEIKTEENPKQIFVAVTSDRGLCGALHSNLSRALKAEFDKHPGEDIKIVTVGEKAKVFFQL